MTSASSRPKRRLDRFHARLRPPGVGDVADAAPAYRPGLASAATAPSQQFALDVEQRHAPALGQEPLCRRKPDAARSAGDQRDFLRRSGIGNPIVDPRRMLAWRGLRLLSLPRATRAKGLMPCKSAIPMTGRRSSGATGVQTRMVVSAANGATQLCVFEQWVAPGKGAPTHSHPVEEVLTVREGEAEMWIGEDADARLARASR